MAISSPRQGLECGAKHPQTRLKYRGATGTTTPVDEKDLCIAQYKRLEKAGTPTSNAENPRLTL